MDISQKALLKICSIYLQKHEKNWQKCYHVFFKYRELADILTINTEITASYGFVVLHGCLDLRAARYAIRWCLRVWARFMKA